MKYLLFLFVLLCSFIGHAEPKPDLTDIYGGMFTGCTVDTDVDEGQADSIGPLSVGYEYTVFCYDSSDFTGVACRVKQGGSTVDASSGELADGEGELLFAGEKTMLYISPENDYISFEALADGTTQVGAACRRN